MLVTAAGCGDDDDVSTNSPPAPTESEYADMTIYFQQATYNGVTYTCLLAGYSNYPGLWCERDENGDPE